MIVVLGLYGFASRADAEPDRGHLVLAARVGIQATVMISDDDSPQGSGPLVDLEAGWRFNRWLSAGLFVAYSSMQDSVIDPFDPMTTYDLDARFFDAGPRIQFHYEGAFAGIGVGLVRNRETWDGSVSWSSGTISELHVGFTFPKLDRYAIQLVAMLTSSALEYDAQIHSMRFAAGVQF